MSPSVLAPDPSSAAEHLVRVTDGGWSIIWYCFLGGTAAGSYAVSAIVRFAGRAEDERVVRVGRYVSLPLTLACGLVLALYAHETAAAEGRALGTASGAVAVSALVLFGLVSAMASSAALAADGCCGLERGSRVARALGCGLTGRALDVLGLLSGAFLASYTGSLAVPEKTGDWISRLWFTGMLLASAVSLGAAVIRLVARPVGPARRHPLATVDGVDRWAMGLELACMLAFLLTLDVPTQALRRSAGGWLLFVVVPVGIVFPTWLRLRRKLLGGMNAVVASVLVLLAGFLLRVVVLRLLPAAVAAAAPLH